MRLVGMIITILLTSSFSVQASGESRRATLSEHPLAMSSGESLSRPGRALSQPSCFTNLTDIFVAEGNVADTNVLRTYTLCANTVFSIGFIDSTTGNIVEGDYPITPRANTIYKCGDSGSSTNNCTLTTGSVGLLHAGNIYPEPLVNSTIQGLTFAAFVDYGVAVFSGGQVTFVDCVFRDMFNLGPVDLSLTTARRRLLQIPSAIPAPTRLLAAVNFTDLLEISFVGCVFRDNGDGSISQQPYPGVITGTTTEGTHIYLSVSKSLFTNNSFYQQGNGYAIQVDDSVSLHSNCFLDNHFVQWGPVQVLNNANLTSANNYGTSNGNVTCLYADLTNGQFTTVNCVPYEASSCSFATPGIPTPSPLATTNAPTSPVSSAPIPTTTAPTAPAPTGTPTAAPVPSPSSAAPASSAPVPTSIAPTAPAPTGTAPTAEPVPSPSASTLKPVSSNATQPTSTSSASAYREASNLAVGGIFLCWLLF